MVCFGQVHTIWNIMDGDGSGQLDRREFVEGLVARPLVLEVFVLQYL